MTQLQLRDYWEQRLSADWNLQGVGFRTLGRHFNEWAYRLRGERFDALARRYVAAPHDKRVLDIGSGTGFYVRRWREAGVASLTGVDLTDAAVRNLRDAFPGVAFLRADISEGLPEVADGSVDVVSAMDVLFHITDDARFAAALREIARVLADGGVFIWSDLFLHGAEVRLPHVSWRSLYRTEALLDAAGLEVVERVPMFVVMNEPLDTTSRLVRYGWYGAMWLASRSETIGDRAGRLCYRLDRRLTATRSESPSTEIMVCRKRGTR